MYHDDCTVCLHQQLLPDFLGQSVLQSGLINLACLRFYDLFCMVQLHCHAAVKQASKQASRHDVYVADVGG